MRRRTSASRTNRAKKKRTVNLSTIKKDRKLYQVPSKDTTGKSLVVLSGITDLPPSMNILFVDYLLAVSGETNFEKVLMGCVEIKRQYPMIRKVKAQWFLDNICPQSFRYPREYNNLWFGMGKQCRNMIIHAFYQYFMRPSQVGPRLTQVYLDENQQPTMSYQDCYYQVVSQHHAASCMYNVIGATETVKLLNLVRVAQVYRLQSKQKFGRLLNELTGEFYVIEAEERGHLPYFADTLEYAQHMRKSSELSTTEIFRSAATLIDYLNLDNILQTFGSFKIVRNPSDKRVLQSMVTDALNTGTGPTTTTQSCHEDSSGYCTRENSFSPNNGQIPGKEVVPPFHRLLSFPDIYISEADEKARQLMFASLCQQRYEFHHVSPKYYDERPQRILRHEDPTQNSFTLCFKRRNAAQRIHSFYAENRVLSPRPELSSDLGRKIYDWAGEKFAPSVQERIDYLYYTYFDDFNAIDFDAYGNVYTVKDFNVDECISLITGKFVDKPDWQSNFVISKRIAHFDTRMMDPNDKVFVGTFVQANGTNGNTHVCCYTTESGIPFAMLVAATKLSAYTPITFYSGPS